MIADKDSMIEGSKVISTEDEDHRVPDDGRRANDETLDVDSVFAAPHLSQAPKCYRYSYIPLTPTGPPKQQYVRSGWKFDAEFVTNVGFLQPVSYWYSQRSLFVKPNTPFSVKFGLTPLKGKAEVRDLLFRCTAVYTDPEYEHSVVRRCENETHNRVPVEGALGIVETLEDSAWYCGSGAPNSHYSVVVPMKAPSTIARYKISCQTSCSQPGVNRRALALDFTAEDRSGAVYGRNRILVRPCATPRRELKLAKHRLARHTMERARTKPEKQLRCQRSQSPVEDKDTPMDNKTEKEADFANLNHSEMCLLRLKEATRSLGHDYDKDIAQQINRVIQIVQQKYNLK